MSHSNIPPPASDQGHETPPSQEIEPATPRVYPKLHIAKLRRQGPQHYSALLSDQNNGLVHYYAEFYRPFKRLSDIDAFRVRPQLIEIGRIHPTYEPNLMTIMCEVPINSGLFQKQMDYLRYSGLLFEGTPPSLITDRDIYFNEYLASNPHPNLCKYHGVTVDSGYVTSLVFKEYSCDLLSYVAMGREYDIEDIMSQLGAAIEHLHSLGVVHVDIKPENVFVDEEASPVRFVLGDFDSMHAVGEKRTAKWSTYGWTDEGLSEEGIAVEDLDYFGLGMIMSWLSMDHKAETYLDSGVDV